MKNKLVKSIKEKFYENFSFILIKNKVILIQNKKRLVVISYGEPYHKWGVSRWFYSVKVVFMGEGILHIISNNSCIVIIFMWNINMIRNVTLM